MKLTLCHSSPEAESAGNDLIQHLQARGDVPLIPDTSDDNKRRFADWVTVGTWLVGAASGVSINILSHLIIERLKAMDRQPVAQKSKTTKQKEIIVHDRQTGLRIELRETEKTEQ